MGRPKLIKTDPMKHNAECFFLLDDQKKIVELALAQVDLTETGFNKAIQRGIKLTLICYEFCKLMGVKEPLNILNSSVTAK